MAVLLTWALFLGWTVVGLALLTAGRFRHPLMKLLLAPTVGFTAIVVPCFLLTRSGYPVRAFATPLGLALIGCAGVILWRARPSRAKAVVVWRRYRVFAGIFVAAFALTAWPLFKYGFDWVANCNDDMANYCLGSAGFRDHGYVNPPSEDDLRSGPDHSHYFWYMYRDSDVRCGVELLIAAASSWSGLATQQMFMPVTVALNLALISAAAGLVLTAGRRAAAVWTAALLAVSATNTFAVVQQVVAQVSGIALLCCSLALLGQSFRRLPTGILLSRGLLTGVILAGFAICYTEATPFLAATAGLYGVVQLARRRLEVAQLKHAAIAGAVTVVLLPYYLIGAGKFLLFQTAHGVGASQGQFLAEVFPYGLTPRGAGNLLGLVSWYSSFREPYLSIAIGAGLGLLAGLVVLAATQTRRGRVFAATVVVMLGVAVLLIYTQNGFGLFKLVMFAQPFVWATVAYWLVTRPNRWRFACAAGLVLAVGAANVRTQREYVVMSVGRQNLLPIPDGTTNRLMSRYRECIARATREGGATRFIIASENNALSKLLETDTRGVPSSIVAMDLHSGTVRAFRKSSPNVKDETAVIAGFYNTSEIEHPWVIDPETGRPLHQLLHTPADWRATPPDQVYVLGAVGSFSVFNRLRHTERGTAVVCKPLSQIQNFAVLRDARGARQNYLGLANPAEIALFEAERDPNFPRQTMAGIGRHIVLDIINPTPQVRVLVNYTTTYQADRVGKVLSPITVVGDRRVSIATLGIGSARMVSPPLAPQVIGPSNILALDFNTDRNRNPNHLSGVEEWWGSHLPRDRRWLAGSARDISVISEAEYAAFQPPEKVARFPNDLGHPQLEYSGIYEAGWVGKEFKIRPRQPGPGHEVVIRGGIPMVGGASGFQTELTVLIDGKPVEKRVLKIGDFEVRVPGGNDAGPRWIECRFSHDQLMPGDGRRLTAHLRFVGFEPKR